MLNMQKEKFVNRWNKKPPPNQLAEAYEIFNKQKTLQKQFKSNLMILAKRFLIHIT